MYKVELSTALLKPSRAEFDESISCDPPLDRLVAEPPGDLTMDCRQRLPPSVRARGKMGRGGDLGLSVCAVGAAPTSQEAVGQHDRDGMPVEARTQPPLILIPAHLTFGLFMELFDGIPPMGIAGQLVHHGRCRQIAPVVLPLPGLPT